MTAWASIDAGAILPGALVSAVAALGDVLKGLSVSLSLPALPTPPTAPDATVAVVNAILDSVEGMLRGGQLHTLMVPISKTFKEPPASHLPPTLEDLQASLEITLGYDATRAPVAYADLVARAGTGGNAGFFSQFATSLTDPFDPNRPQYDNPSDAVAMVVMLVGAADYASIVSAASVLQQLVPPKGGADLAARTVPTPQNVTARIVGSSSAANVGVRLTWDRPSKLYTSPYFPGVATYVKRYAVIRSTDPRAPQARSVLDFFPTTDLRVGMTAGKAVVVNVGTGNTAAFLDDAVTLSASTPVYYCIAWETVIQEPRGETVMAFDGVSNVVKILPVAAAAAQTGSAPNWRAAGVAVQAFPAIARAAQVLVEEARVLLVPSSTPTARLASAVDLARAAAQRAADRATSLVDDVQRLATALSRPMPGLYITQMSSATGGNAFLLAELSKRLGDPGDASRPPFDHGEYVCGICLVAGASRLADLANVLTFFDALFSPATAASNPLQGLLAAIDTAVTQAEAAVFQPDMQPFPPGSNTAGIDPRTGLPAVTPAATVAVGGQPVATDSPANPNAGETNVVPPSDLC